MDANLLSTCIVAFMGLIGVISSSLLTYRITKKQCDITATNNTNNNMIELITKYKDMCDTLDKKVTALELKIEKLELENAKLKTIMADHGITIVALEGD